MTIRTITPTLARRLNIVRQHLSGPYPESSQMLPVIRDLGCLQLDPTSAVARSHLLVLWSRLGMYDPAQLDALLWQERQLFEYWAHCASIVLTEDYPIHAYRMTHHFDGDAAWKQHAREWIETNHALVTHIMDSIRERGPLSSRDFEDQSVADWYSSGWTGGRNVSRILDFLWAGGEIMVAGRKGGQKLWDLADRCLPDWTPREPLPEQEIVRRAAQKSLRALGVARAKHIQDHFTRGRYPGLNHVLHDLQNEGCIEPVQIMEDGQPWPGPWYIHSEDIPLLDRLEAGEWQPRTTLLSPFDNLICDRARTQKLFNFDFRIEIYVPKDKRKYGYFVLPILHGDRLIGRIDPVLNRSEKRLTINAVYAEPNAPTDDDTARAISGAIAGLGNFLGAKEIVYGERIPDGWQKGLQEASGSSGL